jgi:hypothetical protein
VVSGYSRSRFDRFDRGLLILSVSACWDEPALVDGPWEEDSCDGGTCCSGEMGGGVLDDDRSNGSLICVTRVGTNSSTSCATGSSTGSDNNVIVGTPAAAVH